MITIVKRGGATSSPLNKNKMISKQEIIQRFLEGTDDHHKVFVLAWARFLTIDELRACDYLDVYDLDKGKYKIKSYKEWDSNVIPFTKKNLVALIGVVVDKAVNCYLTYAKDNIYMYVWDIRALLEILGNKHLAEHKMDGMKYILYVADVYNLRHTKHSIIGV